MSTAAGVADCSSASTVDITTTADAAIAAFCLTSVNGYINIDGITSGGGNHVLATFAFPLLTYAAGYVQILNSAAFNSALTSVDLTSLNFVGQYILIQNNAQLASLALPLLTYIGQYFEVVFNDSLASLSAPSLQSIANNQGYFYAVDFCFNGATFTYSGAITAAAAGQTCYLTSSQCGASSPTTC